MLLLRFSGIILIVVSSSLAGFLKSKSLISRSKKISFILKGSNMLHEYIEQEGCELSKAIANSFLDCDFLSFDGKEVIVCDKDLKKNEIDETKAFFSALGSSSKKIECDRINNFKLKMERFYQEAENDVLQKCKIYQTFGICIGLAMGILLI